MFGEAIRDGNVDDLVALYEPDAVFIPQPGAEPVSGADAIRAALVPFVALKPAIDNDIRQVVRAGDIATVHNSWRLKGIGPDGTEIRMGGLGSDVMRRRPDGTWGILIDNPWGAGNSPNPD